ncbi:ribonuclease catalytic domain-containing protein [Thermodesulfobacterium hydrogeniphilum]|uniref:ribonuclease catalytic domain-containing protein n=1 Tax=Thermodesulfobacterium hydrogeniphilum TaxID=161156 RepID=UPI000571EB2B|nr:ribonuclease catalytic domain-containing protein [Thermodesulfobacterium hydrogeniphilum]
MDLTFLNNRFADIFYRNKITTVYIKEVKEKRLHIILPSGKEELINYSALISYEEKPKSLKDLNQIITALKEKQENREKLKETFDLKEIWEIIVNETEEIPAKDLVDLILGRDPDEDEIAGFIRKTLEEKLYFKLKEPNILGILSQKEVERLLLQKKRELERLKKLNEGEEFIKALQKGNIEIFNQGVRNFWIEALKGYVLWENQTPSGKLVQEVLKRLNLANQNKIFELLVKIKVFDEDENLEILRTRYPLTFSEKELKEAKELENLSFSLDDREDLTHLQTFTIDAKDTEDFDDALSFEENENQYILYIHIAEVAGFIKPGSALWEGALERASTLYLPDGIFPMLPFPLSHGKFSLKQDTLRPAITFKIILDQKYNILDFKPILSLIKVKKRLTYEDVDDYLSQGNKFWQKLYSIFMYFKKKREKKGALAIFLPEIQIKINEKKEITVQKLVMTPARYFIAEAMILINTLTAEFLYKNHIPAIYRSQPQPSEIIENFEENLYSKLLQLKFLAKSELSTQPAYHSGLGVDCYTTLTSPIRRFLDLLIQYQLKFFLLGLKPLSEEEILKILPELTNNLQRAILIQNKREKYFLLKYLQLYMQNQPLKGLVLNVQNKKAKIYLVDYNITGDLIGFKKNLIPGQEITVKIEKVQPRLEVLRLKLV